MSVLTVESLLAPVPTLLCTREHTLGRNSECSDRGKAFNTSSHLKVHKKIHTGDNLYECSDRGKVFSGLSSLRIHVRTHTGEKPYECNECRKTFSVSSSLRRRANSHWRKALRVPTVWKSLQSECFTYYTQENSYCARIPVSIWSVESPSP